ncbi:MAG: NUDIX domain-containing protein [Bacteroidetes bacterium]|nr:NUDIX domain-containing protein [Bacteroidota bacterium]
MIKIFYFNKLIYLINNQAIFKPKEGAILADIQSADEMLLKFNKLAHKKKLYEIYFFNENIQHLFNYFSGMFRLIEAAGGLVKNEKDEYLFIFRNGKWDLPKGKIEKAEGIKTAAIREVEEECGISSLSIIRELPSTYHTYTIEEKIILKRTYWFEMSCDDTSAILIPQIEEGITDVQWIATKKMKKVFNNTFESVKEVLSAAALEG